VVEVGAGEGIITAELDRRAGYVVAVEIDAVLTQRLRRRFGLDSAVLVVEGDAFRQPLPRLPFRVVSNVPFDSTTRLLRLLLDDPESSLERAALIVQWELARKRTRSRPSTLLGLAWAPWWELTLVRRLPAASFRPPPRVDAGVLVVGKRVDPLLEPSQALRFRSLLKEGFTHGLRRLASPLELKRLGLPRRALARDLDAAEWISLYRFLRTHGRV
jgi:23S rRNA (adenine-N6)-dimethyltransferase